MCNLHPVVFYQVDVDVCVRNIKTGEIARIVGYEIVSYSDMPVAGALYYFEDDTVWVDEQVWNEFVEI